MLTVLIRHEQSFLTARTQLYVNSFPERHTHYAAVWAIVCDHYDEFGELPDEELVATEMEARALDDPEFTDDALDITNQFLRYAFNVPDKVIEQYV